MQGQERASRSSCRAFATAVERTEIVVRSRKQVSLHKGTAEHEAPDSEPASEAGAWAVEWSERVVRSKQTTKAGAAGGACLGSER